MDYLRKAKKGAALPWQENEIKAGFLKFFDLNGRYPSAEEIDSFEFLPSSRSIQRSYGGLVSLRKRLFPEEISSYTTGAYRTNIASMMYKRAQKYEERFWFRLCEHFQEIAIHEQKRIRPGSVASDFFIYVDENKGVCLDLFYAQNMRAVANVINIKLKRYRQLNCPVIFIVISTDNVDDLLIEAQIMNRKIALPTHVSVVTESTFWNYILIDLKDRSIFSKDR